jgi:acyl carrier protein
MELPMKTKLIGPVVVMAALAQGQTLKGQDCPPETKRSAQSQTASNKQTQQRWVKLKDILAEELGIDKNEITPTSRFKEDFGADSLDMVEIVMRVEEDFKIEIPDADACKFEKVCDVYTFIAKHQAK